jgi:hypothetical protein
MSHSYHFADAEHTIVQRDDGRSFRWPAGESIAHVKDVALPSNSKDDDRIVEVYRRDNGPKSTAPYKPDNSARVLALLVAALGDDAAKQAIEALFAAGYQIVETPRPCR